MTTPSKDWKAEEARDAAVGGFIDGGLMAIPIPAGRFARVGLGLLSKMPKAARFAARASEFMSRFSRAGFPGRAQTGSGNLNPFRGQTPAELDSMFRARGYVPRGPSPVTGRGSYLHPVTGRNYHIDLLRHGAPHVDVLRAPGYQGPLSKRRYFL